MLESLHSVLIAACALIAAALAFGRFESLKICFVSIVGAFAYRTGVNLLALQQLLGHKDIRP